MAFTPYRGQWTSKWYSSKTEVDYDIGDALYTDGTNVVPMAATGEDCLGICATDKPSTDAGTQRIRVWVPRGTECTALVDVGTGTPTVVYEGRLCDPDNSYPADKIDVSTTDEGTYRIEKYHSASVVEVSLSPTKR